MEQIVLRQSENSLPLPVYTYFNQLSPDEMIINVAALKLYSMAEKGELTELEALEIANSIDGDTVDGIIEKYNLFDENDESIHYCPLEYYKPGVFNQFTMADLVLFYVRNAGKTPKTVEDAIRKLEECISRIPELKFSIDIFSKCDTVEGFYEGLKEIMKNVVILKTKDEN